MEHKEKRPTEGFLRRIYRRMGNGCGRLCGLSPARLCRTGFGAAVCLAVLLGLSASGGAAVRAPSGRPSGPPASPPYGQPALPADCFGEIHWLHPDADKFFETDSLPP